MPISISAYLYFLL